MTHTIRFPLTVLLLLILSACASEPRLLMPTSPEGIACVAVCDAVRSRCSASESARAQSAASGCDNSHEVQTCVDRAVDDRTVLACEAKQNLGFCSDAAPNLEPCNEARLMCALRCGARMLDAE